MEDVLARSQVSGRGALSDLMEEASRHRRCALDSREDVASTASREEGRWMTNRIRPATTADIPALFDVRYPLSAFGRIREPDQRSAVLFKDATVWTGSARGTLARASVLGENG